LTCTDGWAGTLPPGKTACNLDALADSGETISGDLAANKTLLSGKTYKLSGPTRVLSGVTLTIEPCVKILGQTPESVLAVLPGAKIEAAGEADAPIVFTSAKAAGSRAPGDWGGLIILGNARSNQATASSKPGIEGLVTKEEYGSHTDEKNTESSGTLKFVRVEYVGRDIDGKGNETNGITFGGVGSGTVVDSVMVSNSIDDCFEFFGGAVNASHLVALNCDDDMFDTDHGFSGKIQYAFGRQFPTSTESDSNGFEMDTADPFAGVTPVTSAQWSNVTLCGGHTGKAPPKSRFGMVLRRNVSGSIVNALITGFDTGAVSHRDSSPVTLTNSQAFGNAVVGDPTADPNYFTNETTNAITTPEGFCDCWANPPQPFPAAAIAGAAPAAFPDATANFKGAFKSFAPENNWMRGKWTDWSEK
jgi:hypothetical protein